MKEVYFLLQNISDNLYAMNEIADSGRQKIIKNSSHYVSTSLIGQGIGFLRAILMPVLFTPSQLGIWNLMNLILRIVNLFKLIDQN